MSRSDAVEVSVQDVELESLDEQEARSAGSHGGELLDGGLEMIKGVKVRLEVRVGDAELTVGELLDLKNGAVVRLNQDVQAPVEVLLDGRVVARGELSVVGDNFGVRITELPK